MKIHFNLKYNTAFGEDLRLNIIDNVAAEAKSYGMNTVDGKTWSCDIELNSIPARIEYFYSLNNSGKEIRHEWQTVSHRLELNAKKAKEYTVYNRWTDIPCDSYLYSSAFTDCVNRRHREAAQATDFSKTLRLIVRAPQLRKGERLLVVGDCGCLGNWHAERAVKMY